MTPQPVRYELQEGAVETLARGDAFWGASIREVIEYIQDGSTRIDLVLSDGRSVDFSKGSVVWFYRRILPDPPILGNRRL